MANAGFKTIRIPVNWDWKLDSEYNINADYMARIKEVVDWCYDNELYVILDIHHRKNEWRTPYVSNTEGLMVTKKEWEQIATTFKDYDEHLIFEVLNEPVVYTTGEDWTGNQEAYDGLNVWNQELVNTIRNTGGNNSTRYIMVPTYAALSNNEAALDSFSLPTGGNVIVSVHMYPQFLGISKAQVTELIQGLKTRFIDNNIPVIIGEWAYYSMGIKDDGEDYDTNYRLEAIENLVKSATEAEILTLWWDTGITTKCSDYSTATSSCVNNVGILDRDTQNWTFPEVVDAIEEGYGKGISDVVPVTSIAINKQELTLNVGATEKLIAIVTPDDATDKTVTWTSSDSSIATVDASGNVIAIKPGTTIITASSGDKSATCTVTVKANSIAVTGISLNKSKTTIIEESSEILIATITPDDATAKTVTWTSSNPSIATVDQNGKVTAIKSGTTTITASSGDKSAECIVTVKAQNIPVTSVTLDKTKLTLTEGDTDKLGVTVNPTDATNQNAVWISSDPSIVTVDENGKLTAIRPGTATIIVTVDGKSAECIVTVEAKNIPVTNISLKPSTSILEGETETLIATITPDDATDKTVTWISSNPSIATVDQNGKVTAIKSGTTTITASSGDKSAECIVTVKAQNIPVTSVTLDKTKLTLTEGDTDKLYVTVNPTDATNQNAVWISSNPGIVTVDENGKVTAIKSGTATITVTVDGKSAQCIVTVEAKNIPVTSVTLDKTTLELTVDDISKLEVTINPTDAANKDIGWTSSDPSIVTVDENGKVTAIKPGTATITVTVDGKSAQCIVIVNTKATNNDLENITTDILDKIIDVPKTASNIPVYIYVIGFGLIVIGVKKILKH